LSEKISQEKLQEILVNVYKKGTDTKSIRIEEILEDIKQQLLAVQFK